MKKLSDFEGVRGIEVASDVLEVIMDMLKNAENRKQHGEDDPIKMFTAFMKNSPEDMMRIFAILSEKDFSEYKCDGAEAMYNMLTLANDPIIMGLFLSQSQTGDATSSGSASENTEEN